MPIPVSKSTIGDFDNFIKFNLISGLQVSDDKRHQAINSVLSRIYALYIDYNKDLYNEVVEIDFYNAAQNEFLNIRDLTRWVGIAPTDFIATKLLSCNLKEVNPETVELPQGIAYVQDIEISIGSAKDANTTVPAENTGQCCLLNATKLYNVLTLSDENSWTNVATITALLAYYRPLIYPNWGNQDDYIDLLNKDWSLASNLVNLYLARERTPFSILAEISRQENAIIYNY